MRRSRFLWFAFVAVAIITWLVDRFGYAEDHYILFLAILFGVQLLAGALIIWYMRSWRSFGLVVLGVLFGQWWATQTAIVFAMWAIQPPAP